ncbi:MAG: hypothetical protein ACXVEF_12355 [Polyangiales bacterium]
MPRSPLLHRILLPMLLAGCGTRSVESTGPTATPDAAVDTGANVSGGSATFVVSLFRIGITTRTGEVSDTAWKAYGFDLDGICTTADDSATSKNTCKRAEMSKPATLADGDGCIDNNFGSQLVPLIKGLDPMSETKIVDGIKKGGLTLVLRIDDLAAAGADGAAPGAWFAAKSATGTAKLDGTDTWDVDASSVASGDLGQPIAKVLGSVAIVDGKRIWRSNADSLALPAVFIAGATGTVPITGARVEIDLDAKVGTIGGYSAVTDVQTVVSGVLATRMICPDNPLHNTVMNTIASSADMPALLPHDPAQTCTSMSLGLGIELVDATIGKVLPPADPKPSPCPMM